MKNELRLPMMPLSDEHRSPLAAMLQGFGVDAKA